MGLGSGFPPPKAAIGLLGPDWIARKLRDRYIERVQGGLPDALDRSEPQHVADAVFKLGLEHVVITSVDRDDLADGGAREGCVDLGDGGLLQAQQAGHHAAGGVLDEATPAVVGTTANDDVVWGRGTRVRRR